MTGFDNEYPGNSHKEKAETAEAEKLEEVRKIEPVVGEGGAKLRKPSLAQKFKRTFLAESPQSAAQKVINDTLIPMLRDAIVEAAVQSIERTFRGTIQIPRNRTGFRPTSGAGYTNYGSQYQRSSPAPSRTSSREAPRAGGLSVPEARPNFDQVVVDSRVDAEQIIDRLFDLIEKYEFASLADFYELARLKVNFTDRKWGWADLRGAEVQRVRDGYLIRLPEPDPLPS